MPVSNYFNNSSNDLTSIVSPLLFWYQHSARDLPWRIHPDPYRILVSEIMLQQTRVETVKPYFERFISALPTVADLAQADEMLLLKLWEGLGYYRRVRNLQKAAQKIMQDYRGVIPADYKELLKLPGVGKYTAGSVASIAYNIPVPAVDGNVLRVISRLLNLHDNISSSIVQKKIQQITAGIVPECCPGKFNQALMELGATICLPRQAAQCSRCPVSFQCLALKKHCVELLPIKEIKPKRKIENHTLLIFLCHNQVLLKQRPPEGLLAGLWEFPHFESFMDSKQIYYMLEKEWQISPCVSSEWNVEQLLPAKHIFTHLEWHFHAFLIQIPSLFFPPDTYQWISLQEMNTQYAVPSAFQAYTSHLTEWVKNK